MQSCYHLRVPSSELSGDRQPRGRTCCQVMVSGRGAVSHVECEKQKTKNKKGELRLHVDMLKLRLMGLER